MPRSRARSSWSYPAAGPIAGGSVAPRTAGVALFDAAQHLLAFFPGRVSVEDPAGGGLARVAAEFLRLSDERGRDLGQAAAGLQDQQDRAPV